MISPTSARCYFRDIFKHLRQHLPDKRKNVPDRLKNLLFAEQGAFEAIRDTFKLVPPGRKCTTHVTSHDVTFIDMSLPPISHAFGLKDKPLGRRQVFRDKGLVVWPPF